MKVPIKKILFYSGMVLLGLVVVFLVCRVLLNLDALGNTVRGIFGSLRAIVLGCVMAYLLYPLTRFSEQFLLYHKVRKKTARSLSTAFSTFVLLALIVLFAYFIIPQLVFNVPPLIQNLPNMVSDFSQRISDYLTAHGQPTTIITTVSEKITAAFNAWLQDDPLSALVDLAGRVAAAAKSVLNFIIGIIVMVYLLMSRDQFVGQGKKILFALCRKRSTCYVILKHLRAINRIFSGFVSGKLLDSLIIGIICGICLSLLHMRHCGHYQHHSCLWAFLWRHSLRFYPSAHRPWKMSHFHCLCHYFTASGWQYHWSQDSGGFHRAFRVLGPVCPAAV